MSDEALEAAIAKFIDADRALRALAERETALTEAADSFQAADRKIQQATQDASGALSAAEESFLAAASTAKAIGATTSEVVAALQAEIEVLTQVLAQVSELEPDRLASDLSEIRRELSDQVEELRDWRRSLSETQDTNKRLNQTLEEAQTTQDRLQTSLDEQKAVLAETHERLQWVLVALVILAMALIFF